MATVRVLILMVLVTTCWLVEGAVVADRQTDFNQVVREPDVVYMEQDHVGDTCSLHVDQRVDCFPQGAATKAACTGRGCCWNPLARVDQRRSVPWCFYPKGQCTMLNIKRIDCHPEPGASQQNCQARGCCWRPAPGGLPWCYYPEDPAVGYTGSAPNLTSTGFSAQLTMNKASHWPRNVQNVKLQVLMETQTRVHFKLTDRDHARWEVPLQTPNVSKKADVTDYLFNYTQSPFSLVISRKSSGEVLFDTRVGPLIYSDQFVELSTKLPSEFLYGLGEHRGRLLKDVADGQKLSFWSRDMPPREDFNLYGVHPFYLSLGRDGTAHGVFLLNSNAMDVILAPDRTLTYRTIGGVLDFYLFTGPTPDDVIRQYSDVIGLPAMPPYWSLGFHLCRWGYNNDGNMKEVVDRMIAADMPYDVQWNDIDYMYKKYDFTLDTTNYKNLPQLVDKLHALHKRYTMIIDAAVPYVTQNYKPYTDGIKMDVFIKKADGSGPLIGKVWPGKTVFPDFSHPNSSEYWYQQSKDLHDRLAYDGMWIDMDEPSNFFAGSEEGCPGSSPLDRPPYVPGYASLMEKTVCPSARQYASRHYDLHSLFGYQEMVATNQALRRIAPGKRPFIVTRSSFSGAGHYGFHWLGDNNADWPNLKYSIAGIINQNMYGFSMVGADVCGFMGTTNEELCVRWMQLGAFYPFMRNHNTLGAPDQDPANPGFSAAGRTMMKYALVVRYSLLPHLYSLLYRSHTDGTPVVRPLMFQYPQDTDTYDNDRQFMWGDSLLVSPVLSPGVASVEAYVPEDTWYDYFTGERVLVHGRVTLPAPLHVINVHIRGGSIVATQQSGNSTYYSRQTPFSLTAALPGLGGKASGQLFWDDGESETPRGDLAGNLLVFSAQQATRKTGGLTVRPGNALPYRGVMQLVLVRVMGVPDAPSTVTVNGQSARFVWDSHRTLLVYTGLDMRRAPVSVVWKRE